MPTYEYQCESCKKHYDLQESFSAETRHTCKKCGKGTARRVLHAPRVVFKGSGFYSTDNKPGRVAEEKSTSDADSSSSSSSKSDSSSSSSSSSEGEGAAEAAV